MNFNSVADLPKTGSNCESQDQAFIYLNMPLSDIKIKRSISTQRSYNDKTSWKQSLKMNDIFQITSVIDGIGLKTFQL